MREENGNPKISVIIPTYNRAMDVQNAIDSVLGQTLSDLEVVVVDDGSSDDTAKVLGERYGDRIRYFGQENQGVSAARNKGIAESRGQWIAFLDSDDRWESDKLEWQFRAIERSSPRCGACYTDVQLFNHAETRTLFQLADEGDRHEGTMGVKADVLKVLVRPGGAGMIVCPSSLLARADLIRKIGGLNTKLRFQQDTEFMFRLALLTSFCYVNRPLVWFDRSPAEVRHVGVSSNWNQVEFVLQDSQVWLEGLLRLGDGVPEGIRKLIRVQLATVHSGLANWHLEAGKYSSARSALSTAIRLNLTFNVAIKWLLTWMSPQLALRTVRRHQENRKESAFV